MGVRKMFTTETTRPDAFRELGLAAAGLFLHLNGEKDDDGIITSADGLFKALGAPEKEKRALIASEAVLAFPDGTLVIADHLKANKNFFGTIYYSPSKSPWRAKLYVMADFTYTLDPRLGRPLTSLKRADMMFHSLPGVPEPAPLEPDPFPGDVGPEFRPEPVHEPSEAKREPEKTTTTTELNLTEPNRTEPKDKDARKRKQEETPSSPSLNLEPVQSDTEGIEDGSKGTVEVYSESFVAFWEVYPKKVGKGLCWKWWKSLNPPDDLVQKMIQAVREISQTENWTKDKGRWVPLPITWLRQGRWEDSPCLSSAGPGADYQTFWNELNERELLRIADELAHEQGFTGPKQWFETAVRSGKNADFLKEDIDKRAHEVWLKEIVGSRLSSRKDFVRPSDLTENTSIKKTEYKKNTWITVYEDSRKMGTSMHEICLDRGLDYDTLIK